MLVDFANRLGLAEPGSITTDPDRHLKPIGDFMQNQTITEEDRVWIHTRLGYFIGEVLVHRFDGQWSLNEMPDSRYFLHYVVGSFGARRNAAAMVAPFEVADYFLRAGTGAGSGGLDKRGRA